MGPRRRVEDAEESMHWWEFQRRDSVSYESKSSSSCEPVWKRHRSVTSLVSPKAHGSNVSIKFGMVDRVLNRRTNYNVSCNEVENDFHKVGKRNKATSSTNEVAALDDMKIYTKSLLDDLRFTQEKLFKWMREEIQKILADETDAKQKRRDSNGVKRVEMHHSDSGNSIKMQHKLKFEQNANMQHWTSSLEAAQVQEKHEVEEGIQQQHQSKAEGSIHVENHQKDEMGTVQMWHQTDFEQCVEMPDQSYIKENIQKHHGDTKSSIRTENRYGASLEQSSESNAAGTPVQDFLGTRHTTLLEKNNGDTVAPSAEKEHQYDLSVQIVQLRHKKNYLLGTGSGKGNDKMLERFINYTKENSTDKDEIEVSVKPYVSTNTTTGQTPSSMYFTLPSVTTKSCVEKLESAISSSSCVQVRASGYKRGFNSEKGNWDLDSGANRGYNPFMMQVERLMSFSSLNSKRPCSFSQNNPSISSILTGFPVSLHRTMTSGFGRPSHFGLENLVQGGHNVVQSRGNGETARISEASNLSGENATIRWSPNYRYDK